MYLYKEFKSLHSFWLNVYEQTDTAAIDRKSMSLFEHFYARSLDSVLARLSALEQHFRNASEWTSVRDQCRAHTATAQFAFKRNLRTAHAFFHADKFRGFVLGVHVERASGDLVLDYEALVVPLASRHHTTVIAAPAVGDNNTATNALRAVLLESVAKLRVSSEYDHKEAAFLVNYADLLGAHSNPTLLLHVDALNQSVELDVQWWQESANVTQQPIAMLRTSRLVLNASTSAQRVIQPLFKRESARPAHGLAGGVYSVRLCAPQSQEALITRRFLVMPESTTQATAANGNSFASLVEQFWSLDALCRVGGRRAMQRQQNALVNTFLFDELFLLCEADESYWSASYPDPKSDVEASLSLDTKHRIK